MASRRSQQIAKSISLLMHLPHGEELVQILGDGEESSNLDALEHWISNQVYLLDIEQPDERVEMFIDRLNNKLIDVACTYD